MQSNNHMVDWLHRRGITDEVIQLFNITIFDHPQIGPCLRIPYTSTHSKYRRDPMDERKPKYLYDAGGKVTLFGLEHLTGATNTVLITEGELDALVAWSNNIPAVSSTGGALSFQAEWAVDLAHYQVILAFDNDDAGAEGMVKVLQYIPDAKVVFVPELPGVKDVSDFVARGGDLHALLSTARTYTSITDVEEDRQKRIAQWLPVRFHDRYFEVHRQQSERANRPVVDRSAIADETARAKAYPMTDLLEFRGRKTKCLWHSDSDPSLHYYEKTNSAYCFSCGKYADSIDVCRNLKNCSFKEAVKYLNS